MKSFIISLLFVLLSTFGVTLQAQTHQAIADECGTQLSRESVEHYLREEHPRFLEFRLHFEPRPANSRMPLTQVPVQMHIVRRNDVTGGLSETVILNEFANYVDPRFVAAGLEFVFCSDFRYMDNTTYYSTNDYIVADAMSAAHNLPNVINMYFTNTTSACGWAYFTTELPRDYVLISNLCANSTSTIAHELGHYFNLYHTHEYLDTDRECPDGSNCSTAGDLICDTPADPNLVGNVDQNCIYTANEVAFHCDAQPYMPDVTNIMSYARRSCRTQFSNEQIAKMAFTAQNGRAYLNYNSCDDDSCPESNILYVKANASSGGDGTSWATAFTDLQEAIDLARQCDQVSQIWVAEGAYLPGKDISGNANPADPRNKTFYIDFDVEILGGFPATGSPELNNRNPDVYTSLLSGDLGLEGDIADNAYSVVTTNHVSPACIVNGFTISFGNASSTTAGISSKTSGGGWYNGSDVYYELNSSSPTIIACTFADNHAKAGGAFVNNGEHRQVNSHFIQCRFYNNTASSGGAIFNTSYGFGTCFSVFEACYFYNNIATLVGGAVTNDANFDGATRPVFINNIMVGNSAGNAGGAIMNYVTGASFSEPKFINCTIVQNSAGNNGGAVANFDASDSNGAIALFRNCILWDNTSPHEATKTIFEADPLTVFEHCLIDEPDCPSAFCTQSIFGDNPDFVDATNGDFQLQPSSPAIDQGSPEEAPASDYDGNPRPSGNAFDIGAYESSSPNPCAAVSGPVAYVKAGAGSGTGSSWGMAFNKLQDALALACQCPNITEIWVAAGTYYPDEAGGQNTNDQNSTFQLCNDVAIYGGFSGTETARSQRNWANNVATLSGDINQLNGLAGNSYTVVTGSGTNTTAVLDGFTISGGNSVSNNGQATNPSRSGGGMYNSEGAPTVQNCIFTGNSVNQNGAGMYNINSAPTVTNCTFTGNIAGLDGGGMYNFNSPSLVSNCTFTNNTFARHGGGMFNVDGHPTVSNCTFSGHSTAVGFGGAVYNQNAAPQMTDCTFTSNASQRGGAMYNVGVSSTASLNNCTFTGNSAPRGGAIFNLTNASPNLTDCNFTNNTATEVGGAIFAQTGTLGLTGCTFTGNTATGATGTGGGVYCLNGVGDFQNCTFYSNSATNYAGGAGFQGTTSNSTIDNCIFAGNSALLGGGAGFSSGLHLLTNCIFLGNTASESGGGIANYTTTSLTNCSFSGNSASGGGALYNQGTSPMVSNSIFWGNSSEILNAVSGSAVVSTSIVQGGYVGMDNKDQNPLFVNQPAIGLGTFGNLRLTECSPAINTATAAGAPSEDFDGNARPASGGFDMGAYEFQGIPKPLVVFCQSVTVYLGELGEASVQATALDDGSSGCGDLTFSINGENSIAFGCGDAGTQYVTLTGSDEVGRSATCVAEVIVIDDQLPVAACFNQIVVLNGEEALVLDADDLVEASDNCGIASIELSPAVITCAQLGSVVPVTATITDESGNMVTCTSQITVTGLPCGWSQNPDGVNCENGNSIAYNPATQVFSATSTNCYYANPFSSDELAFAQYSFCGNGSITAQVTSISGSTPGWAGVVMREDNTAGAKKAQLTTNLSSTVSRREFRTTTGGQAYPQQFPTQNRYWLRLVRSGNQFSMYVSSNGQAWSFIGVQNIAMNACIEVGLVVTNYTSNSTVTATFANVSIAVGNNNLATAPSGLAQPAPVPVDFSVFPNPTSGEINVDLSAYANRTVRLELYDAQGKTLKVVEIEAAETASQRLDLSAYQNGLYLIRAKSEGLPDATKRVVVHGSK